MVHLETVAGLYVVHLETVGDLYVVHLETVGDLYECSRVVDCRFAGVRTFGGPYVIP